jgi:hypothetical protein
METNLCPKCNGVLIRRMRGTVMIDQCEKCGGILLDHGELEELIATGARCHDRDDGFFSDSALLPVFPKAIGTEGELRMREAITCRALTDRQIRPFGPCSKSAGHRGARPRAPPPVG